MNYDDYNDQSFDDGLDDDFADFTYIPGASNAYPQELIPVQGEEFKGEKSQDDSFYDDYDEEIPQPDIRYYAVEESKDLELQVRIQGSGMEKLPSRNIDDEPDIFDFLFFDQMRPDELLESLESQILSIAESSSVYLRIGKLFNFVCRKLDTLLDTKDILTESEQLSEVNSLLDLFHRCVSAVRYTNFANVCLMPEFRMELDVTNAFLNNLLILATSHLDQLPINSGKLFLGLIAFIMHTPDPYVIQLERVPEIVLEYLAKNLPNGPNRNYFKVLSVAFWISQPELVPQYIEKIILPLKIAVESSLEQAQPREKIIIEEEKTQVIKNPLESGIRSDDETLLEILKFLVIAMNSDSVRKQFIKQNFHKILYDLLRSTCMVLYKAQIKISSRVTKLVTNILSNLLVDLESDQLKIFQEMVYEDICTCIEKAQTDFVLSYIVPMLAGSSFKPAALCLHLENDIETSLNMYRSKSNLAGIDNNKQGRDDKALNSEVLTNQEKALLLQNIQKLSFDPKGMKKGSEIKASACEWRRSFKVDFSTQYAMNTKLIHEDLQNNDGVFLVFQCLVNDEICKIGAFCSEKFVKLHPLDNTYNYKYGGNNNKASFNSPENFLFYYSQHHKLHFLTEQPRPEDLEPIPEVDISIDSLFLDESVLPDTQTPLPTIVKPSKIILSQKSLILPKPIIIGTTAKVNVTTAATDKKDAKKKNVFVDFSDNKITLSYNGNNLIEYFPINPDNNKVAANLQGMLSEEEKRGQHIYLPQYDPNSFAFIQSLECWVLSYPKDQKLASVEEIISDLHNISSKTLLEHLAYLRSNPITLVPRDFTIDQIFSLLFKGYDKSFADKITCKVVPQEQIELSHQAQKLVGMYQGSRQNILDLFLSSKEGVQLVKEKLNVNEAVLNEKFITMSKKDSKIIRELLAPERLASIVKKTKVLATMNNKQFLTDYLDFSQQIDIFMKIDQYHETLVENEHFFYTLMQMIHAFITNDIYSYKSNCTYLKLQQRLYGALVKVLKAEASFDQFSNVNVVALIPLLLQKLSEMHKFMDSSSMSVAGPQEQQIGKIGDGLLSEQQINYYNPSYNINVPKNDKSNEANVAAKKKTQELEQRLSKKILKHVMSTIGTSFERGVPLQARKEAAVKIRQFKLIGPISKFLGDLDNDNTMALQTTFYKQLINLLKIWSDDPYLSEIFWEQVSQSENKNAELNYSLYQMLLNQKEQAESSLEEARKEESKMNPNEKAKHLVVESKKSTIEFFNDIDRNLRKYYYIEVVEQTTHLSKFLVLPLAQAYPKILKELCVDSTSMKNASGEYEHHYKQNIASCPSSVKPERILKELGDLSTSLPISDTNAIFMRYDKQRMDVLKALIFGSKDTPYAHGAFIYDIFLPNNYPSAPPLCNLETTGNATVRFNPNLYSCGKVCLSLLGTWRGNANENWNPQLSTILQVLISIQSIIMTEDVYYNEPGYETSKKQVEGQMLNEGYNNIVKYANVKFAMVEALKKPAPWFKDVIQIHFYLKKDMILEECGRWVEQAKKTNGKYTGLVKSHNSNLSATFSGSNLAYHDKLVEAIKELKEVFGKLNIVIDRTIRSRTVQWNKKPIIDDQEQEEINIETRVEKIDDIDVTYEEKVQQRAIDINDERVTNRWSRYIGAMGIEAVEKQANAQICLFGLNALGVEIAKNIILSGIKRLTICDGKTVELEDLSGQFYLSESDIGRNRAKACLSKLQALNQYVVIEFIEQSIENCYEELGRFLVGYNVVITCEGSQHSQIALDQYCRSVGSYFISASLFGFFARIFCDFGENFRVLDKTGEEYQDMIIKTISNDEKGLVTLLDGTKHNLQDGDEVMISQVIEDHEDHYHRSINETQHRVRVVDKSSFYIGDTSNFKKYLRNGVVKQLKQAVNINFKSLYEIEREMVLPFDPTISFSDWNFVPRVFPLHVAMRKLDVFKGKRNRLPGAWSEPDANEFIREVTSELKKCYPEQWTTIESSDANVKLFERIVRTFSYTCSGVFPPLAAFMGGVAAQEAIKAITKKYMPINQFFYYETSEIVSGYKTEEMNLKEDRDLGLKRCIGETLHSKLAASRLFMIGAGAIGCELLKNFAMLSLGTSKEKGKEGRIYLTDPDVIENSNLNRQFLFREKHIRKPKSTTAAAVAVSMNSKLSGNIKPLVEKVYDLTEHLFSNAFFSQLDVVANALDNVNARRYVDSRCVNTRKPLLESGTLGPKGHVQVIVPFKTESYGSQQDPQEDNEIPYCTLKMFPEETLHCVEWARDKFNKMFTQKPRSFEKMLESVKTYEDLILQEHKILAEAHKFLKNWPHDFKDCIAWSRNKFEKFFVNDIKQLLHVYPLNHRLESGNLFWTLPKRPPSTVAFDPENEVHISFVAACACLRAITCGIPIASSPRDVKNKLEIARQAAEVVVKNFVQSDKKSKSLKEQADKGKDVNPNDKLPEDDELDKEQIAKNILACIKEKVGDLSTAKNKLKCAPQEFEKDEDDNFHIDVLYAMTNCRALNYKLEKMDWITVKLKAGRIIPALATTTSAIAGLQTIELVKLIANVGIEDHKNSFLNLSIPVLTQSEPSAAPVYNLTADLKANLWDRWEVNLTEHKEIVNLETLFKYIKESTKLEALDCLRGNTAVYVASLMNMPNKQKEQETLLQQPLRETLGVRKQKFVDLTITLTSEEARLKNPKDITLKGVPQFRLIFEAPKKGELIK